MNRLMYLLVTALLYSFSINSQADIESFKGRWVNQNKNSKALYALRIFEKNGQIMVTAKTQCKQEKCKWGTKKGVIYGKSARSDNYEHTRAIKTTFTVRNKVKTLLMTRKGNHLSVQVFTDFKRSNTKHPFLREYTFIKRKSGFQKPNKRPDFTFDDHSQSQQCIRFNPFESQILKKRGEWSILDGNKILFSFDDNKSEAKKALHMLKYYKIDQQCYLGDAKNPSFTYFLSKGKAPKNKLEKETCFSFDNSNLVLRQSKNNWMITEEGKRTIYKFGSKVNEAQKAFDIMKSYQFTHACQMGVLGQRVRYLRR